MKKQGFLIGAALVSAMALVSCNQAPQTSGPEALSAVSVGAFHGATVTTNGSTITAARSGEGQQGVTLRRSAVLVHFTVQGEHARIRIARGAQTLVTRPAQDNAVMIGPGGATAVTVFAASGDQVLVNVTSVVDCANAPEGACQPPQFTDTPARGGAAAPAEDDEADAPAHPARAAGATPAAPAPTP